MYTPPNNTDPVALDEAKQYSHIPVLRQLGILGLIFLLIFGSSLLPESLTTLDAKNASPVNSQPISEQAAAVAAADQFADVFIQAEAAFVFDIQTQKVLFQRNADAQLPLASLTKLMTALVAHELVAPDASVVITDAALNQHGDNGFNAGERFSLKNLLGMILMNSSNDGAFAIASAAGSLITKNSGPETFVEAMNIKALDLGLTQTYFRNPTGLDISETEAGAYGSARDITFLMEYILTNYPSILDQTQVQNARISNEEGDWYDVRNTNPIAYEIPGIIGSKTGYTTLAGGNLTVAFNVALNRPVIIVVLGSTRSGRFEDVLTLTDRVRKTINPQ